MADPATTPGDDALDESRDGSGRPRGAYARLFEHLDAGALAREGDRMQAELAERGVVFGGEAPLPFEIDPVPRIVEADEWELVEAGLIQRVGALNAFLEDAYGERRIVAEGIVPAGLLESAEWFDPAMAGPGMPRVLAHVAGPDLVRGADGELRVLEDNLRAPSGLAYALAAREVAAPIAEVTGLRPRPLEPAVEALGRMLRAVTAAAEPRVVVLNDGPSAAALYEHAALAALLGLEVAAPADLERRGERLLLGGRAVDVIYRRVDDERLLARDGTPTALGGLLLEPLRAGTLACVNSPGSGIADDKAIHTRVEAMIGFYLGQEPVLRSVPGRWLGEPGAAAWARERMAELVLKPRSEFGGSGVVIGPLAEAGELAVAAAAIEREPDSWVAQEPIALSMHPTVVDGAVERRHVDLRPFVITRPGNERHEDEVTVAPGGLTRFAREAGSMVVNSGQGGGAKDTWVL